MTRFARFRRLSAAGPMVVLATAVVAVPAVYAGRSLSPEEIQLRVKSLPKAMQTEIAALQYVLSADRLAELLADPRDYKCRRWIDRYWEDRDPVWTTPQNEIRREHDARVSAALRSFPSGRWPGWDQRGEVLIRYGQPAFRRAYGADVDLEGFRRPGEVWFYPDLRVVVMFEDAFASGQYTYYLTHVKTPGWARERSDRRKMPSKYLDDLNLDEMRIDAAFHAAAGALPEVPDYELLHNFRQFRDMILDFPAVLENTPSAYAYEQERMHLPVFYSVDCFRGGEFLDRVEVNVEYQADTTPAPPVEQRGYLTQTVVWSTNGDEVDRSERQTNVPVAGAEGATTSTMVTQHLFTLPPDFYRVGVTVKELGTGRFSSYRSDETVEDFESTLAISDIVLARSITKVTGASVFNRGAIKVVPHPAGQYRKGGAIPIYFEAYNLAPGRDGTGKYTVEYRIIPKTPRPEGFLGLRGEEELGVASRFSSTSAGNHDTVQLTIRTDHLWPGEYALEVTIVDEVSLGAVERTVGFEIVE